MCPLLALFVTALEVYVYLFYSPKKFQLVTLNSPQVLTFHEVYPTPKNAVPFECVMYYNLIKYYPVL